MMPDLTRLAGTLHTHSNSTVQSPHNISTYAFMTLLCSTLPLLPHQNNHNEHLLQ